MILLKLFLGSVFIGLISATGTVIPKVDISELLVSWFTTKYDTCFGSNFGEYIMHKIENAIEKCDYLHYRNFHPLPLSLSKPKIKTVFVSYLIPLANKKGKINFLDIFNKTNNALTASVLKENKSNEEKKIDYLSSFYNGTNEKMLNTRFMDNLEKIKDVFSQMNQLKKYIARNKNFSFVKNDRLEDEVPVKEIIAQVAEVEESISNFKNLLKFFKGDLMKNKSKTVLKSAISTENIKNVQDNKSVFNSSNDDMKEKSETSMDDVQIQDDKEVVLDTPEDVDEKDTSAESESEKKDKLNRKKRAVKYHYHMNTMDRKKQASRKLGHSSDIPLCVLQEMGFIDAHMNLNFDNVVNPRKISLKLFRYNFNLQKNFELCYDIVQELIPLARHMDPKEVNLVKIKKFLECQIIEIDKQCLWSLRVLGLANY